MFHRTRGTIEFSQRDSILRAAVAGCLERLESRVLLTGTVFATILHDLNGNGNHDPEEPGLQNWTVFVDYNEDGVKQSSEPSQLTDIDGECFITGVTTGTWDVRQVLQSGWTPSPGFDVVDRVHVPDNDVVDVLFLDMTTSSTGSIEGTVWNDVQGDGVRDAGDPGLPGWTTFIDLNRNQVLDPAEPFELTDANGFYTFPNITPGQYKVREILPAGWDPTVGYDQSNTVDVNAGATSISDFGNFSIASVGAISGSVWNDVNADGIRAPGDAGLSGWTIYLDKNLDGVLDPGEPSAITDPGGVYSFPSVVAGNYRVTEVVQPGWFVSPGLAAAVDVTVVGENTTTVSFGNYTPTLGSISGRVWNDVNGDGFIGGSEPGLAGWTVFIDQDSSGTPGAGEPFALTDPLGAYSITGVPIGANVLREVTPVGWQPTAPGTAMQLVNVPNGTNVGGINFGNQQRTDGAIRGTAYSDSNRNHVRDAGERGLAGLTVFLDSNDNGTLDPTEPQTVTSADLFYTPTIDESGTYAFTHLAAGTYHVREIIPALLSATLEADRHILVNLLPGEDRGNVNFANRFRGNEIHGTKYNDLNRNHVRDAGEPGIPGVTIYLDLNRNNALDPTEPTTLTAGDGSYSFITNLSPGAYVVREVLPAGWSQTFPTTTGGILWPTGVSNPAVGNVTPTSITASLAEFQTLHQNVSLTLPTTGPLTNKIDVFLLFDDTGSFTSNSPIVRAAFPQIISTLQASLPGIDLAFGVGRFEEYANFAAEYGTGRPFILNQPIIASSTPGFATAIQSALDRTAPGYGGDTPETDIEALFQTVTGRGFDGNNNGTLSDSGAAGLVATQLTPGVSGDVPSFASFTIDPSGNVLPAAGGLGGAGFRAGALPIILTATDTGFAFQPRGETSITGIGGLTLPISALTQFSRNTTPFNSGAGIQETVTALNALGALVVGLGTNPQATIDPRQGLESLAKLTGAINHSTTTIANGTVDPIAPGDPLYFQITSGFGTSVANGIVTAIQNAVANVAVNITLKTSDPTVHIITNPGVVNAVGAGETAAFDVQFTGDGRPHRFDLQFVRQGTDVVLGSIPVVLGTPIPGDGYEFEDLDEGEIDDTVDFGNFQETVPLSVTGNFEFQTRHALTLDFSQFVQDSLSISDLEVIDLATNLPVSLQSLVYDPMTNRATVQFSPAILPDGNYQLRIATGAVTNLNAPFSYDFFFLNGDATRDRSVNSADFNVLATNFGTSGRLFTEGDFTYDGDVNSADFNILATKFGTSLPSIGESARGSSSPAGAPGGAAGVGGSSSLFGGHRIGDDESPLI